MQTSLPRRDIVGAGGGLLAEKNDSALTVSVCQIVWYCAAKQFDKRADIEVLYLTSWHYIHSCVTLCSNTLFTRIPSQYPSPVPHSHAAPFPHCAALQWRCCPPGECR